MTDKFNKSFIRLKNKKKNKGNIFLTITVFIVILVIIVLLISLIFRISYLDKPTIMEDKKKKPEVNYSIQVSVLNATEVKGLAGKIRDYLRSKNFDVVEIGNYEKGVQNSFIIDRVGDTLASRQLADIVGLPDSMIVVKIDSSYFLKASLIIGNDYKKLKMFRNSE